MVAKDFRLEVWLCTPHAASAAPIRHGVRSYDLDDVFAGAS